ncbi:MAG: DUF4199 domain-containing protein [Bacteroidaceae bacterium]|nr:DUF4199 domain-containing protein [Bacteroidaceae bacterium]
MEEQEEKKVIRINLLQVSMTLGTNLGLYIILVYAVTAMTVRFSVLSLLALPLMLGIPVVAFFLVKHYRDKNSISFFPFPISWIITLLTFLFATVLSCMAVYLYLRFIDHGAFATGLMAWMETVIQSTETVTATMTNHAQIEQYNNTIELLRQSVTWFCSLPASGVTKQLIQASLMWGNILSLIIALITAKRIRLE